MAHQKLIHRVSAYLTKTQAKKVAKVWRDKGYFSESDYVRDLIRFDLKNQ
jgi:Arc/MetJ-type ribon-helix-helix transcriptional regulator